MLQHYNLGNTDIKISKLGLGTVKFGRNTNVKYPTKFELPDDNTITKLFKILQNNNINLIDTAPAYGISEERIGKLLENRHNWVIASKAGEEYIDNQSNFNFTEKHLIHSVERSLTRLKTDYIDILLIHSNGNDIEIIDKYEVFNTLSTLKQQGKIRAYGMSTKTIEGGIKTIENSDVAMVTYNAEYQDELPVLNKAKELNKAIIIKKALGSGHIKKDINKFISDNFECIYSHPAISSIILGTINESHLLNNIAITCNILK